MGVGADNRRMRDAGSQSEAASEPAPSSSVAESAEALDTVLQEMEDVLRDLSEGTRRAAARATPQQMRRRYADMERALLRLRTDLHRVSHMAVPPPVRRAATEAEQRVTTALDVVVGTVAPGEVQATAAREGERLVRAAQSTMLTARAQLRPQIVHNAARVDRLLDYWQAGLFRILWLIVPPEALVRTWRFQALVVSRFLTDIALQMLLYGALIATARGGGGALDAAALGVASLLPGVALGLYGGALADALPKRVALALAYLGMAVACFAVAWGTAAGFWSLVVVLFIVRALHQVSQPSEASAVPMVADAAELASANSVMSLASSAGEVTGKAVLAPILVRASGVRAVVTVAGILFVLAATRVFDLVFEHERRIEAHDSAEPEEQVESRPVRDALAWLAQSRDVLWMLLLAAVASTVGVVLGILGPQYTKAVLDVDPANALYVFMPAAGGLLIALAAAPPLIRRFQERTVAAAGFACASVSIASLGLVDQVALVVGPLIVVEPAGNNERVIVAALLSVPLGVGTTLAAAATQTYVGRSVPPAIHGRAFAIMGTLKDGLAVLPLLGFGYASGVVGIRAVLVAAPLALLALAGVVAWLSTRFGRHHASAAGTP